METTHELLDLSSPTNATCWIHTTRSRALIGRNKLGDEKLPFKAEVTTADGHMFHGWHMWHIHEWTLVLHRNQVKQVRRLFAVRSQSNATLTIPIIMVSRVTGEYLETALTLELHCEESELKAWTVGKAGPASFALRIRRMVRMCKGMLTSTKSDRHF